MAATSIAPLTEVELGVMAAISASVLLLQFGGALTGLTKEQANSWTGIIGNVVGIVMMCAGMVTWPKIVETQDAAELEKT